MNCRICSDRLRLLYTSDLLPEYIWPTNKKIKYSKCKVYECINCKILQLQNFSEKKIKSFYGNESFVLTNKKKNKMRLNYIEKNYGKKILHNKKILDIGGGINPVSYNKNLDIVDFLISPQVKKVHKGNIFIKDINKEYIKKKYDVLFLIHTLEHLKFPKKTLININQMMKPNSKLFIEVPNFDFFIRNRPHYALFHQHLNMFCIKSLQTILALGNLKIEKIFTKSKDEVIFCSVIKTKIKAKINKINNIKKIQILKNQKNKVKKNLIKFFGNNEINLFGAGGSSALFLSNYSFLNKKLNKVFDNDKKKINKKFLGIKKIEKKRSKNLNIFFSLSSYNLDKKNNYRIV